ncbi:MAG: transporter substrate-binding domain-containing protein [Deltaproteobacteria bacterium]|nr:MAG: transporter substrate-binding domain-containing protein [Deltaproteobacteria bacterium]
MRRARVIMVLVLALTLLSPVTAPAGPVLDRILKRGELVVGTSANQPPLTAKNKQGEVIGLDADLATLIATAMGVKPRFETMPFAELLPALEAGRVDIILSGMTVTPKRNMRAAFVGPYYITGKGILTKDQTVASFKNPAQINSAEFTLVALNGSTSQMFVEKLLLKARLITTATVDEAVGQLIDGKVDALVADFPTFALAAFRHLDKGLAVGAARFTFEPIGIGLPANDPLLVKLVQNFLSLLTGTW